ncbi:MAG: hypothetical protein LBU73_04490 [Helicobacteraceae bacterium]|nr:hypothetical protein [Helicobacteraceae bacterium]
MRIAVIAGSQDRDLAVIVRIAAIAAASSISTRGAELSDNLIFFTPLAIIPRIAANRSLRKKFLDRRDIKFTLSLSF